MFLILSKAACCFGLKYDNFRFQMDDLNDFQNLTLAVATAVVYFHREASNVCEYTAKEICDTVNLGSRTRSFSYNIVESDLEIFR